MTGGPLFVQTDGLRTFSQTHGEIAAGVSQLLGGGTNVAGVETSHGQIAFAVQNALTGLLGARQGALQTTARSGDKIAELLQKAAAAYEKGDERSAAKLRAAEASSGPSGAAGAMSAALGQLGQLGQTGGGAVQSLTQGLQQIPQQVAQGVQQIVQAATGPADADPDPAGPTVRSR